MIEVKGFDQNIVFDAAQPANDDLVLSRSPPPENRTTNGYMHPSGTIQNIGILKNASTYFNTEAERQGWTFKAVPFYNKMTRLVILRDPYERYLSGLAEDFIRYVTINNEKQAFFQNLLDKNFFIDFFDFLFDADIFVLADHTQLQSLGLMLAIEEVGLENFSFIKMTDKLGDNLNLFLQGENLKSNFSNVKIHENKIDNENFGIYGKLQYYFYDRRNRKRKDKLLEFLQPDYKLINSINFFNGA